MATQDYVTFSAVFALLGIGHLLTAANRWMSAQRHAAHDATPVSTAPFPDRRGQLTYNFLLASGVFYALVGIWLGWRASSG